MVVLEDVARSVPSAALVMAPDMGRTERNMTKGSPGVVVVVERTGEGSPLALTSGGSRSPVRGESLLQWTDPQDPTSILFSLDDATESIERESLNEGILAMMEVLNQARGVLRDVIIPTGWVATQSLLLLSSFFMYFCVLTLIFFSVPYRS